MHDYDWEDDWFLSEKTWEEYYNEGFEAETQAGGQSDETINQD